MSYALITGASQGIGKELAKVFASNGYNLVLVARNEESLHKVKVEIEDAYAVSVCCVCKDLTMKDAAMDVYNDCKQMNLTIDCLVNNVGIGDFGEYACSSWDRQYDMVQLNIVSLMQLTHLFLPNMIQNNCGKILNVSSTAWLCSGPKMSVYYASKAFVTRFSSALREEVKPHNIHVTTLCPPSVKTQFQQSANMKRKKETYAITAKEVALKGYQGLMHNKAIVYCNIQSIVLSILVKVLPDSVCSKVIMYINKE